MSDGLRSEKFNIVSNDHGRTQKFLRAVCKTNFTDHKTSATMHSFRDSILVVLEIQEYKTATVRYAKISSISIPCHRSMQVIAIIRLVI